MKLMIVDDDRIFLKAFHNLLETKGHEVESFQKPEEAWGYMCENAFGLDGLMLDLKMPRDVRPRFSQETEAALF